jgi:hypothetical protein
MASTGPSRGGQTSSLGATRQLLDELDALMEKMLALPVSEADDADVARESTRLPKVSATLTVLPDSSSLTNSSPRHDDPAPLPSPHADFTPDGRAANDKSAKVALLRESAAKSALNDAGPVAEEAAHADMPAEAIPPSLLQVQTPEIQVLPSHGRKLGTLVAQPLIWTNAIFDLCTHFLGPVGRWLRTGQGRNVLGLIGIAFLVLAVAWLVRDWMSWLP